MLILLLMLGASFTLCCLLTPLAERLASRWGLLDWPDARRKLHVRPVPVVGGLAVLSSGCLVVGCAFLASHSLSDQLTVESLWILGLFLAVIFLCLVGVLDDLGRLRGRHKLLGQVVAAGIVMACGVRIHHVEVLGWGCDLSGWQIPITLLWLLGAINSLNLLDGMDGMLGCVGFITAVALAIVAVLTGNWAAACVAIALAGSLLGFLCYNLPPASIFMGDSGSMVTGLVLGTLGIQSSFKAPATIPLLVPLTILTIPFLDTAAALVRRKLTGRSIYTTDRGHLHHCLRKRGFSVPQVLVCVSILCGLTAAAGLTSLILKNDLIGVFTALTVVAVLVITRLFGYAEYSLVKNRLSHFARSFLQSRGRGRFQRIDVRMHGTANWKTLLDAVTAQAFDLNLQTVRLDVSAPALDEEYHAQWDRFEKELEEVQWRAELPVMVGGRVVGRLLVTGYPDAEPMWSKVAALDRSIEKFEFASASKPITPPHLSQSGWKTTARKKSKPLTGVH
jgi:UDP-GlcNAc:undecaprenyl-phosphate GlcNAc-1-phosphate transferase